MRSRDFNDGKKIRSQRDWSDSETEMSEEDLTSILDEYNMMKVEDPQGELNNDTENLQYEIHSGNISPCYFTNPLLR